jgi:hypothetical protein
MVIAIHASDSVYHLMFNSHKFFLRDASSEQCMCFAQNSEFLLPNQYHLALANIRSLSVVVHYYSNFLFQAFGLV